MNVNLLSGVYTDATDYRVAYPRNYVPVVQEQGISSGYLRPADGIIGQDETLGPSRGGISFLGSLYRVLGGGLYRIGEDGGHDRIGDIAGTGHVSMAYSFDYLCIVAGGGAYLYNGFTLQSIVDTDLGYVIAVAYQGGYFIFTDGENLIVNDLDNPFSINPLKYGSSEVSPDPIVGLLVLRDELYAINTTTIEVFDNVGGNNFPFQRNDGAVIQRGALGTYCSAVFLEAIAFLGGGFNESTQVWLGNNGSTVQISTREIDLVLKTYTLAELQAAVVEVQVQDNQQLLYIHLPDRTLVYDGTGSAAIKHPIWFVLDSGIIEFEQYRAQDFVWIYNRWNCADPTGPGYGYMDSVLSEQYDEVIGWDFSTQIIYNESRGAIFNRLELVALPGRVAFGDDPMISTSYSNDGMTWSMERSINAGKAGQTLKRLCWFQQGMMREQRIQKFRGTSDAHLPVARLEVQADPLNS